MKNSEVPTAPQVPMVPAVSSGPMVPFDFITGDDPRHPSKILVPPMVPAFDYLTAVGRTADTITYKTNGQNGQKFVFFLNANNFIF
jgi:hypothetical protein